MILMVAVTSLAKSKAEKQADARKSGQQTLAQLYASKPSAKAAIKAAAGYAAFSNFGMKILLAGGGKGHGIAVDNRTQQVTYMKMLEVQAGLGVGIKKFRTIFVFETKCGLTNESKPKQIRPRNKKNVWPICGQNLLHYYAMVKNDKGCTVAATLERQKLAFLQPVIRDYEVNVSIPSAGPLRKSVAFNDHPWCLPK